MTKGWKGACSVLEVNGNKYTFYSLQHAEKEGLGEIRRLPYCIRVLAENILRHYDGSKVTDEHVHAIFNWGKTEKIEIPFHPARILMQDFTGVPAIVDLASLRDALAKKGIDPEVVNPLIPVDLVIDHSVQADYFGTIFAYQKNVELEYKRNRERYQLLKWAQQAFKNLRIIPPGMGIVHQVNLEYLAHVVMNVDGLLYPDTLLGMDSHTPMINSLGIVGWGVGGIEAEAAMLGQPVYMLIPKVVGLKLVGELPEGVTTTDLVLTITHLLRKVGVVGKFVEVFGPAVKTLSIPERATIANMSPEFGCTITYFPIDSQTIDYLLMTGRNPAHVKLVEHYARENMLWYDETTQPEYTQVVELDLSTIEPTIAGPRRPHDKILLREAKKVIIRELDSQLGSLDSQESQAWETEGGAVVATRPKPAIRKVNIALNGIYTSLKDGDVVLAAITSCTNTSNPLVIIGAGLVAKRAVELGLKPPPWVKTVFAPGSRVVVEYLKESGLMPYLEALGFHVTGYGCMVCIGNSGSLIPEIEKALKENNLITASVLSGNRNFEARIHPLVKMNFLASPPLVIVYALAGTVLKDFTSEPVAHTPSGDPVYLKDLWYSQDELKSILSKYLTSEHFRRIYRDIERGDQNWQELKAPSGKLYQWDDKSTYIRKAPFFDVPDEPEKPEDIKGARVLLVLGDTITTDHISPAGRIPEDSPAGKYLVSMGVKPHEFNTYGSRRGNHEVMIRGTFSNVRLKNLLVNREGGWTIHFPTGEVTTVYEAAIRYQQEGIPLIVLAGKEYGSGSSRDWAAKGTKLLGIRAVIAESFERIHRSNLVGMGVLPLQFMPGENWKTLGLRGDETFYIYGISQELTPGKQLSIEAHPPAGSNRQVVRFKVIARLDTPVEVEYFIHGGILPFVYRQFLKKYRGS